MQRNCEWCGDIYEAVKSNARWCSQRCGKRAQRAGFTRPVVELDGPPRRDVTMAAERELERAGLLDTVTGQLAVALATAMETTRASGSQVAALSKELRATMKVALSARAPAADAVDELRDRRDRKRTAARS